MDRELLLEIGCEEIPAGWLPRLTAEIGDRVGARLAEVRLAPSAPIETFSTPRRLTVRIDRLAERQTDLEELLNGPPVSAAFGADGRPTPAAEGFARKSGVEVGRLERVETPRGVYLAFRKHQRGRAAIDVLGGMLGGVLRDLTFPKLMRWDAVLDDGELPFGRPIRWILFLYGGRVVPFSIRRTEAAQSSLVQEVRSGAITYGHRFLTTSGRAGRAIKVRSFDDYRARLLENFVVLERGERHDKIGRELDAHARRLGGRVSTSAAGDSTLLQEVPDLVEYPSVVAGTFAPEFLDLPDEVLTTTMVHHQHYFPVVKEDGRLMPAFLAVTNTQADNARGIARNAERVLTARLRDARFFWESDRSVPLEERLARLETIVFHKKLGTYKAKTDRIERLARWIAAEAFGAPEAADNAATAARLAKADLVTEMVREFTELQGRMGGIYAREEGRPEDVWKAIYFHYLPISVEADAPPTRKDLGAAAVTWAAVSLADKLDTVVGLFAAGDRPTGSRDPLGLRRAGHGIVKVLADLPQVSNVDRRLALGDLVREALGAFPQDAENVVFVQLANFFAERLRFLLERRGFEAGPVNAIVPVDADLDRLRPLAAVEKAAALAEVRRSPDFEALAELFKRVKNISKGVAFEADGWSRLKDYAPTADPAETTLIHRVAPLAAIVQSADRTGDYAGAFKIIATFREPVAVYFDKVLVMDKDETIRQKRLQLMAGLRDLVMEIADISELAPQTEY